MKYGHPPERIDEYQWRDVQTFLAALPPIWRNERHIAPED